MQAHAPLPASGVLGIPRPHCFQTYDHSLRRTHLSKSFRGERTSARPKYAFHPRMQALNSSIVLVRVHLRIRRMISRVFALKLRSALSLTLNRLSRRRMKVNPRNLRFQGRSTALLAALTLKSQPLLQIPGHTRHDPFTRYFASDIDVAVIGIAGKTAASSFHFPARSNFSFPSVRAFGDVRPSGFLFHLVSFA